MTLIQLLEELADTERAITIPANEVEHLVERFGDRVRRMGRWNVSGDGSLEIPVCVIREAATQLGAHSLTEAVRELKTEQFTKMLEASSADSLIEIQASSGMWARGRNVGPDPGGTTSCFVRTT